MKPLPEDFRERLFAVADDWTMQPSEWSPGAIVRALKTAGFVRIKRERPAALAPYRYHLKRTAEGRAALGLAPLEGVDS